MLERPTQRYSFLFLMRMKYQVQCTEYYITTYSYLKYLVVEKFDFN